MLPLLNSGLFLIPLRAINQKLILVCPKQLKKIKYAKIQLFSNTGKGKLVMSQRKYHSHLYKKMELNVRQRFY